jgi:hypothetical protein
MSAAPQERDHFLKQQLSRPAFRDLEIEWEVERAVRQGARLPHWGWPVPGPYNGATGQERIVSWQKLRIACAQGWLKEPDQCSICTTRQKPIHYHAENYLRGLFVQPICRTCHFILHRRFAQPDPWLALIDRHGCTDGWPGRIAMQELRRDQALQMAERADPTYLA